MPDARGFGRSVGRGTTVLLSAILLAAGPLPAVAQEAQPQPGLLSRLQVGPYVGITNQHGSNMEYAIRLGTRTAPLRLDLAAAAVPWRTQVRCADPSSRACRTRHPVVVSGFETAAIIGPFVTLGLPTFPRAGFRVEVGAVQRSAEGIGSAYRLYGILGIQFHR